jgi:TolB-like protein
VNKKFVTLLLLTAAISAQDMAIPDLQESDDEATEEPITPEEKMANPEVTPPETKYKRRVLLTIFVNESQDKNREYLGESIPEAFSAPLVKTGNFVVLNRKSVDRYLHTMGITISDLGEEENAVRLGKAAGADVVVVGKFVSVGDSVTIEAKAIDVQAGVLSVQDSEQIKTNTTMFDSINRLAERMSAPMAEKMQPMETPPPPAEVVLDEEQVIAEVKKIEEKKAAEAPAEIKRKIDYIIRAGGALEISLGYTRSVYPLGFGGIVQGTALGLSSLFFKKPWLEKFEIGLLTGYLALPAKNDAYETLSQIPIHGTIGYMFSFSWFGGVNLTPLVSGGMHFGRFTNTNGTANYRIPAFSGGARAECALSDRLLVSYTLLMMFEYDQGLNYTLVNFLAAGYRW